MKNKNTRRLYLLKYDKMSSGNPKIIGTVRQTKQVNGVTYFEWYIACIRTH